MNEKLVWFKSEGINLAGVLHLPEKLKAGKKVPGIVLFHGFTGTKLEPGNLFVKAGRYFAKQGFATLRFDFRGCGDSEGDFIDTTLPRELIDAENAVKYLMKRNEIDSSRIAIAGLSMGGAVTACTAYKFREIRTAVLWNPLAKTSHVAVSIRSRTGKPKGAALKFPVEVNGWRISKKFVEDMVKVDPLADIAKFRNPVLVVCGSKDASIDPIHSQYFIDAVTSPKKKVTIPGADHTFTTFKHQAKVFKLTADWIKKHTC
ncbi:MAG: hypothetical protein A2297_07690 [Elusimicrobia bacterium RIFOXYB2_FULL_48_7]|nr:MAG: hypothetical protein A2297_07690 [Elusimicrobia bacterium RIFOXYB2_FULL_48_7]